MTKYEKLATRARLALDQASRGHRRKGSLQELAGHLLDGRLVAKDHVDFLVRALDTAEIKLYCKMGRRSTGDSMHDLKRDVWEGAILAAQVKLLELASEALGDNDEEAADTLRYASDIVGQLMYDEREQLDQPAQTAGSGFPEGGAGGMVRVQIEKLKSRLGDRS